MVIFGVNGGLDGVSWCISWLQIPGTCPDPPNPALSMPTAPPTFVLLLLVLSVASPTPHQPTIPRPGCPRSLSWWSWWQQTFLWWSGWSRWSPWGWLWGWGSRTFWVSERSNRQEQEQEQRHTGHCHAPFPYHWRPSTPRTLPPDHSPPHIRTESMPTCRHIRDGVSSTRVS